MHKITPIKIFRMLAVWFVQFSGLAFLFSIHTALGGIFLTIWIMEVVDGFKHYTVEKRGE